MKLGLFTDPHYSTKELACKTRRPSLSYGKIREAMEHFVSENVDAVICLGDLVDDCGSREENVEAIKRITDLIRSYGLPFYCMMGNHDYQNFTREEFNEYTKGAYPPFSLEIGESLLILLDCNYRKCGRIYAPGDVDWKDTRLPEDQLSKMRELIVNNPERDVYVLSHQNIDSTIRADHVTDNADEIRTILNSYANVRTVIQGHYHRGNDNVIDGIKYHTLPAMCEGEGNYFEIYEVK